MNSDDRAFRFHFSAPDRSKAPLAALMRAELPQLILLYGDVFPIYHCEDVLSESEHIDQIVRDEGERTVRRLLKALLEKAAPESIDGIAFRKNKIATCTPAAAMIDELDAYRVGWELIDHGRYAYWSNKRAVVV